MSTNESNCVFISYWEDNEPSRDAAAKLERFLTSWGVETYLHRSAGFPSGKHEDEIKNRISKSTDVIQVVTHKRPRDWLERELKWALDFKGLDVTRVARVMVLHSPDVDPDDVPYLAEAKRGQHCVIANYDHPESLEAKLASILIAAGVLAETHGHLQLPDFGRASGTPIDFKAMIGFMSNFQRSNVKGLEAIHPDRQSASEQLAARFKALAREGGKVRLLGFTLKRFVIPRNAGSSGGETTSHPDLGTLFQNAMRAGAQAEILQLSPECHAARQRVRIESPDKEFEESLFMTDGQEVRNAYRSGFPGVKMGFYDVPYAGLVIFDDELYVELYHLGTVPGEEGICGKVPILMLKPPLGKSPASDDFYSLFESHFSQLWNDARSHEGTATASGPS